MKNEIRFCKFLILFTVISTLVGLTITGCSNKNKATELETQISNQSDVTSDQQIGVDKDGDMVFRKKTLLTDEIRKLQDEVMDIEDRVYGTRKYKTTGLRGKYQKCFNGKSSAQKDSLKPIPPIKRVSEMNDEAIKFGIDPSNKKLASVTEEKLFDYVEKYKKYRTNLQQTEDDLRGLIESCESL